VIAVEILSREKTQTQIIYVKIVNTHFKKKEKKEINFRFV